MKKYLLAFTLAALVGAPAFAATYHSRVPAQLYTNNGYDAYAAAGSGGVTNGPAVISDGQYAGWDPDPSVRLSLLRDSPSVLNGGN